MRTVAELSAEELDGLIERVREAAEHGLALSGEDLELLLSALVMLAELQQRMADSDITLQKLRKLAGIVKSSEKLSAVLPGKVDKNKSPKPKKPRRSGDQTGGGAEQPVIHQRCHHAIEGYTKGQRCPECERGTLSKYAPAVVLRISGQTPLIRTQHVLERLRCSTCGAYFTLPTMLLNRTACRGRSCRLDPEYHGNVFKVNLDAPNQRANQLASTFTAELI